MVKAQWNSPLLLLSLKLTSGSLEIRVSNECDVLEDLYLEVEFSRNYVIIFHVWGQEGERREGEEERINMKD